MDEPGTSRASRLAESQILAENRRQLWDSIKKAAFVIGTALISFVALRNTLTWHAQRVWGASGDLWQCLWQIAYDMCGGDSFKIAIFGTLIVTMGTFWILNLILICIDYTGKPAWVLRFKIQDTQNFPVDPSRLKRAVFRVLFNQLVVGIPFIYIGYRLMIWRGCNFGRELPTFPWVVYELFIMIWAEEIGFYYSHRMLHHPKIYKYVHKVHHEWTSPIGLVSLYAHPVEHVISNLLPPLLGPLLIGAHIATALMWYAIALASTTIAHCGYHFPFLPSPEAHDFHHLKFNQNFGVLGVLDRLHGTDSIFRRSKAYERHFLSLSLVPVKQLVPDPEPSKQKGGDGGDKENCGKKSTREKCSIF